MREFEWDADGVPKNQTMKKSCGECRHFDPMPGGNPFGLCRRYAPRKMERHTTTQDGWPAVAAGVDWCGEFNPKGITYLTPAHDK